MIWIIPLAVLIIFELLADIFAKEWSLGAHPQYWIIALAGYLIGNTFWLLALKNGSGLARGAILFSLVSEVLALCVGFLYYGEHVSKVQAIGIGLALVSLVLIFWE